MKKIIALFLSCVVFFVGCSNSYSDTESIKTDGSTDDETVVSVVSSPDIVDTSMDVGGNDTSYNFGDPELMTYVEENIYLNLVDDMAANGDYYIEEVRASYISQEYIDELSYNSQPNVYFGYTLQEIDEAFEGNRYVFTLGDNGQTIIKTYQAYNGEYEKILKNVAIGTGVIIVCVVVAVATGGAALPAECATISLIFATAAEGAAVGAVTSGAISAGISGTIKAYETGDMDQALKAALVSGSEGFASGAIIGSVTAGASQAAQIINIARHYPNAYLTATQIAKLQKTSGLPIEVLSKIETIDEYNVLTQAGLKAKMIGQRLGMIRDIDINYVSPQSITSKYPNGRSNFELMQAGLAPFDPITDTRYELHHIGQTMLSPLAILTSKEHDKIPNLINESQIIRKVFDKERAEFWKNMAKLFV